MPTTPEKVQSLEQRRAEVKARIGAVSDLRPGSVVERYRREEYAHRAQAEGRCPSPCPIPDRSGTGSGSGTNPDTRPI